MLYLGSGVDISVSGTHSIVKVSESDPSVSGETTASAYTMTQGTDYTMTYTPTGPNTGIEDRTVTVTITGIGKFSGQTTSVSYTQKADAGCTTATTCTPSTTITYSNYSVSYNGGAVACNAEPSKSNITVTADKITTTKDTFCQENSTTDNGVSITDFNVSYSPSGNNTGTSNRTVTGTVTHNGSIAGTFTFTQNSGSTCQTSVTSTTYAYRIDAADFGECETETSVTVYGTPTYHYSDGTTSEGNETILSIFPSPTLTYRLGAGTSLATASQNSTSSSRTWTVTASFKHNNSDHTLSDSATQSAGPCNPGGGICILGGDNTAISDGSITTASASTGASLSIEVFSRNGMTSDKPTISDSGNTNAFTSISVGNEINSTSYYTVSYTVGNVTGNQSFTLTNSCGRKYTVYVPVTGDTMPPSCDCSTISISCSPTTASTTGNQVSTTVTVTGGTNCGTTWKAYNSSGVFISSGNSGSNFSISTVGTYTIRSSECSAKTATFTVSQGSVNYTYTFTNCMNDKQIALFASDATPSGSHIQYAMLSAIDGTSATVVVNSTGGTIVNGSTSNSASTAKIGDTVKLYSVTLSTSAWSLEEIITLTARDRTFTYGNCDGGSETPTITSTTYTYELVANDMDACDTTTTGKVYFTPKHHYSDGTTSNGTRTEFTGTITLTYKYQADVSTPYASTLPTNENNHALDVNVKASFTHNGSVQEPIDIIQQDAGPCTEPDTSCTASNSWSSINVTAINVDKCATSGSFTVVAIGTHTNTDCSTSSTMTTLSEFDYTVKYRTGTTGTYNLASIDKNELRESRTWYYQVTSSEIYGSKTKTGSFTQDGGPCTPVIPTLTCNPLDMSYVDSTKTMTATFDEMVASDVTINFNLKINNNTSVSDSITISEGNNSGSKTLSTSQAILSTAGTSVEITSISPNKDSEYEYNCDTGYTITPSVNYVFKFDNPDAFSNGSSSTRIIHTISGSYESGPTTTLTSTKNGSNIGYSMSSNVNWITTSTGATTCSWEVSENTSTSSRSGVITLTQTESNKTLTIEVSQQGATPTCDCNTVSISCNPTSRTYNNGASVSTTVTVTGGTNCITTWKAYSDSTGELLGSGDSGDQFTRTALGSVTLRADACTGKSATFTVKEPEVIEYTVTISNNNYMDRIYVYYSGQNAEIENWGTNTFTLNTSSNRIMQIERYGNELYDGTVDISFGNVIPTNVITNGNVSGSGTFFSINGGGSLQCTIENSQLLIDSAL